VTETLIHARKRQTIDSESKDAIEGHLECKTVELLCKTTEELNLRHSACKLLNSDHSFLPASMTIVSPNLPPGIEGQFTRFIADGDDNWMAFSKIKHYTNAFIVDKDSVSSEPLGVTVDRGDNL
jgi:hypothetical protein